MSTDKDSIHDELDSLDKEIESSNGKKSFAKSPAFVFGSLAVAIAGVIGGVAYFASSSPSIPTNIKRNQPAVAQVESKPDNSATFIQNDKEKDTLKESDGLSSQTTNSNTGIGVASPDVAVVNPEDREEYVGAEDTLNNSEVAPAYYLDDETVSASTPNTTSNTKNETPSYGAARGVVQADIEELEEKVSDFQVASMSVHNDIKDQLRALNTRLDKLEPVISQNSESRMVDDKSDSKRLDGFAILSITSDGKFAVVKSPSSVITLFKGEKLRTRYGLATVTEFVPGKKLLKLSNGYFIDETLVPEKKVAVKKKVAKQKVAQSGAKPSSNIPEIVTRPQINTFSKEEIEGYSIIAVVEKGEMVMLRDKKGAVFQVVVGNTLEGYGSVKHITENGDVVFTNHIIRKTL